MGTHYKGSKKEVTALNAYIKLIRAADSLNSRLKNLLSINGLTESQFNILESLFHLGPLCQKDLSKKLLKSGGNITLVVGNLEKRNLVKREQGKLDRRYYTVILTSKGQKLIEKVFPSQLNAIVNEMGILSEIEQVELQRICKILGKNDNQNQD